VLWGDKIFVTAADSKSGKRYLLARSAVDGKELWTKEVEADRYKTHNRNSLATSSPVADAERVYFCWATPDQYLVLALDHAGQQVWQADLGPYPSGHGFGVSPIRVDDLLIAPNEPDGDGALIALDCKSGAVRWKTPRHGKNATYSTPCVLERPGRDKELIFTNWQHGITGVDVQTGKVNWEISVFEVNKQERAIVSPLLAGDLVIGTCGFTASIKHLVAVRPGEPKTGTAPREVWRLERATPHMPTPLVKGEYLYICTEQGVVSCVRIDTGKSVWQERLKGTYSASLVGAGDQLYCVSDAGDVTVIKAGTTFEVLGQGPLGEATQATPAIAGGRLIFRTERHLLAVRKK